jgi:hypothetical protein
MIPVGITTMTMMTDGARIILGITIIGMMASKAEKFS